MVCDVPGSKITLQDDVVISGMSGRFPECDTIEEFQQKLFSGVDMVRENNSRWPKDYLETYSGMGFMNDLRNFDAPFFGAHPKLAERTDPIVRTLLETSFEAVLDAGVCPTALRGTETAVVVVVSSNEAADWWSADPDRVNGYEFLGCTRTMYSNRISFSMDLKGPSYTMDSQSSSGLLAIQQAYHMLKCGMVDGVIVAGVNLVLNPHFNVMFKKLNMLSPDGKCKTFDADANGYARSEAAVAVFLQRDSDARRVYGYVAAVNANCDGYKEDGCFALSAPSQIQLYHDTYQRFGIDPLRVSFVEAHGYSTLEGDKEELNGIASVFCGDNDSTGKQGRREPLLIGSVKSNVGSSEPVGGLVSVIKILLAMENGILPPNLHFKTPNPNVPALKDGRLRVVDKLTVWNGEYAAINSFGIGGTNAHLVLKRNGKEKTFDKRQNVHASGLPRIVAVSGRTEDAVRFLVGQIENVYSDNELCALINNIFSQHIQHYNYRAFSIFGGQETITEVSTYIAQEQSRPICFIFSGMGSQWAGMCQDLLRTAPPVFRQTMDECSRVLESVDFDLYAMLGSNDNDVYANVLNSFVGITCTQIALVDILRQLQIEPDFIIGHSIGELGCAYADRTLSLEQTVLATYWRGKSLLVSQITPGAMAAVGLSAEDVRCRLPTDVTIACHNSADNVTISGPADSVNAVVHQLQSEGIFAREVNSSGYAFHSQHIAEAAAVFKTQLEKIIASDPKRRSKRWISTSVPDSMWNTPSAQYSSVEYHLNNLLSPVFFNKALTYVPDNAVVIEVAPHALLQSILKSSLGSKCTHVGLLRRKQSTVFDLLSNIGRMYNAGLQPKLNNLYPSISFPVSRQTPMIQSMIKWDHSTKWFLVSFLNKAACSHGEIEVNVDISKPEYKYLTKCVYDDNPTFPVAAYLTLIWEAVSKLKYSRVEDVALVIENFQLMRKSVLSKEKPSKFVVNMLEESGDCEIRENGDVVARAAVRIPHNVDEEMIGTSVADQNATACEDKYLPLKPDDIYQDLRHKGYSYSGEFKRVLYVDNKGENGKIAWSRNWVTYLEAMLQLHLLGITKQQHYTINHIRRIVLHPKEHIEKIQQANNKSGVPVKFSANANTITSAGIEISGVKSTLVSARKKQLEPIMLYSAFVPHFSSKIFTPHEAVSICTQLVFENFNGPLEEGVRVAEIIGSDSKGDCPCASVDILETAEMEPYITLRTTIYDMTDGSATTKLGNIAFSGNNVSIVPVSDTSAISQTHDLVAVGGVSGICYDSTILKSLLNVVAEDGFLLLMLEDGDKETTEAMVNETHLNNFQCKLIAKFQTAIGICSLIRKTPVWKTLMSIIIRNDSYQWIDSVKMALRKHKIDGRKTMLVYHGDEPNGLIGFMKSIRREPFGRGLRCLFIDNSAEPYKIVDLRYIEYLRKGLAFNVYCNGEWGSYRNFKIRHPTTVECEHAFVGVRQIGDFSSLSYIESRIPLIDTSNLPNHEICHVYYTSIYAHDIRCALGLLPYEDYTNITNQGSVLGHEYSGRDSKGKRVFGMVGGGALATTVLADKTVTWPVPEHWSLEQAATIPRVYSIAYYALVIRGNLQQGEAVFIHAGIMSLCLACAHVAVGIGARVFIGFNNSAEKKYLIATFPELTEKSFVDLQECAFDTQLLERTNGKGVDVIFDSLNSLKRNMFVDSLAFNGRLVEFEKGNAFDETSGYAAIEKNITFHKISHYTLWVSEAGRPDRKRIQQLVFNGIKSGSVKPIGAIVFSEDQIPQAFRDTQSANYAGKIVVKIRDEESLRTTNIPKTRLVKAYPSAFLNQSNSYIVTGGLTDLGIQITNWLISRGATKIVLLTQYRPVTGYQCLALRRWKNCNADITLSHVDVTSPVGAQILLDNANKLAPLGGIFHAAHMECDQAFSECTQNQFELLWKCKVDMAQNLDLASRKLCPSLKYFVGFSDIAVLFGNYGKSALTYANSAMEMIYQTRKAQNYPATIIRKSLIEEFWDAELCSPIERVIEMKNVSLFKNMPDLLTQPYEIVSIYNGRKNKEETLNSPTEQKLKEEIADILGVSESELVQSSKFQDIGIDPVIKSEIQNVLIKFAVKNMPREIGQLSFAKLLSLF